MRFAGLSCAGSTTACAGSTRAAGSSSPQACRALGPTFLEAALAAVAGFERFDADNDPHGEHDFGALSVEGHRLLWKVDCYDSTLTAGSPDPADPAVTTRVLTLMLAKEY